MPSKVPFYFVVSLIAIIGATLSWLRHDSYGVPWTPGKTSKVWNIEAQIQFDAQNSPVKVSMASPKTQSGFTIVDKSASSPGYGIAYLDDQNGHRTEWTIRHADGPQSLYYKTQIPPLTVDMLV